jgi:putative membrane protein insertion efficiency factor
MHTPLTDAIEGSQPARGPLAARIVLGLLRGYKILISPLFTGACRFQPSCADYMAEAVKLHGAGRGVWLGMVRLSRCRPFGGHGYDPVPRT